MNLLDFNDEELIIFLKEGVTAKFLRSIFSSVRKLSQKIKGFRINKVSDEIILQKSKYLIKVEKDKTLIDILTKHYADYKQLVKNDEADMVSNGYPTEIAESLAIVKSYNEKFLPLYFKIEGISEERANQILKDGQLSKLVEKISSKRIEEIIANKDKQISEKLIEISNQKDDICSLKKDLKKIKGELESLIKENTELKTYIDKKIKEDFISVPTFSKKIEEIDKDTVRKDDFLESLTKVGQDVTNLEKQIMQKQDCGSIKNISVSNFENNNYDKMDEDLDYCIGDVIENIAIGFPLDVLKQYLIEVIYSKKPIVCPSKNVKVLSDILSSILTGGNYTKLTVTSDFSDDELINKIESIKNINGNKVIIINNKLGVSNCDFIFEYIKNRPFNEKYIFEIPFEKELIFMPLESLNFINFFISEFKPAKIEYKYSYDFSNDKRISLTNADYTRCLELIGVKLYDNNIMNVNYYGILALSIIPFVSINLGKDAIELVNKIVNHDTRIKCEAVIHD